MKRLILALLPLLCASPLQAQLCVGVPNDHHAWRFSTGYERSSSWNSIGAGAGWSPTTWSGVDAYVSRDELRSMGGRFDQRGETIRVSFTAEAPLTDVSLCAGIGVMRDRFDGTGPMPVACLASLSMQDCPPIVPQSGEGWRIPFSAKLGYAVELPWDMSVGAAPNLSRELRQWTRDLGDSSSPWVSNWHGAWRHGVTLLATFDRFVVSGTADGFGDILPNKRAVTVSVQL